MKTFDNPAYFEIVRDLLEQGKSVRLRIRGESMTPFFPEGREILLHPICPRDLRRGTPVLAQTSGGTYVFHRILHLSGDMVVLQGDGNLRGTEITTRDRVYAASHCNPVHRLSARIWQCLRPVRRYPLALWKKLHGKPSPDRSESSTDR